eukprot:2209371-Pyramimonas_sp.AAC.1
MGNGSFLSASGSAYFYSGCSGHGKPSACLYEHAYSFASSQSAPTPSVVQGMGSPPHASQSTPTSAESPAGTHRSPPLPSREHLGEPLPSLASRAFGSRGRRPSGGISFQDMGSPPRATQSPPTSTPLVHCITECAYFYRSCSRPGLPTFCILEYAYGSCSGHEKPASFTYERYSAAFPR